MINLLPEEMREKERQELEKLKKQKEKEEIEVAPPTLREKSFKIEEKPAKIKKGFGLFKSFWQKKSEPVEKKKEGEIEPATPISIKKEMPKSEETFQSFEDIKKIITSEKKEKVLPRETASPSLEISLMPFTEKVTSAIISQRKKIFLISLILALIILFIVWLGFKIHYSNVLAQIKKLEREISIIQEQTQEYLDLRDKIIILNKKAIQVEKILAQHPYWTKFFNILDANTVPGVFYNDISVDVKGTVSLSAVSKDINSMVQQLVSFQSIPNFIKNISINNINRQDEGVSFILELNLVDNFFEK